MEINISEALRAEGNPERNERKFKSLKLLNNDNIYHDGTIHTDCGIGFGPIDTMLLAVTFKDGSNIFINPNHISVISMDESTKNSSN